MEFPSLLSHAKHIIPPSRPMTIALLLSVIIAKVGEEMLGVFVVRAEGLEKALDTDVLRIAIDEKLCAISNVEPMLTFLTGCCKALLGERWI